MEFGSQASVIKQITKFKIWMLNALTT
jgi:hypothetical protein